MRIIATIEEIYDWNFLSQTKHQGNGYICVSLLVRLEWNGKRPQGLHGYLIFNYADENYVYAYMEYVMSIILLK